MENRNGLVVASEVNQATGRAERDSALRMDRSLQGAHEKTLGADKGYDTRDFVADLCISGITPHVAQNISRSDGSAIDGRTARHKGYTQSINARKPIEQVFGWIKQAAGLRQLKARGRLKVGAVFRLHVVAYNLVRITNLLRPRRCWHESRNERAKAPRSRHMAIPSAPTNQPTPLAVVNLIDAAVMTITTRGKALVFHAF